MISTSADGWQQAPIWRPHLPESSDGMPLATTIRDLFQGFPYHRLPLASNGGAVLSFFLRPEAVLGMLVMYVFSKTPLEAFRNAIGLLPQNQYLWAFIAIHNLALAIFSGITAWNSWAVVLEHFFRRGFMDVYCDPDGELWRNGLGAWSTIFYLSKYYEFVDTWILVLKGKPASFLQVYHHTGIAFIMWAAVASQSAWLLFVVLLNSVIHTIMYIYFFIKTIAPHVEIRAARYLTRAQITQFFVGIACTVYVFVLGSDCDTESSRFALACLHLYGYGLIALFFAFAKQKYKKV
jgi:hypothetical protein